MAKQKKESTHSATFAKGGKQHMFPQQAADRMEPGTTRDRTAKDTGQHVGSSPGASGGKTKMFGFQPANTQTAGRTSSY
jgi:hypothetical protein